MKKIVYLVSFFVVSLGFFSTTHAATEYITNGDFENLPTLVGTSVPISWTTTGNAGGPAPYSPVAHPSNPVVVKHSGVGSVDLGPSGVFGQNGQSISQTFTVPTAGLYTFSFWYAGESNLAAQPLSVLVSGAATLPSTTVTPTGPYQKYTTQLYVTTPGSVTVTFADAAIAGGVNSVIDDISFMGHSATGRFCPVSTWDTWDSTAGSRYVNNISDVQTDNGVYSVSDAIGPANFNAGTAFGYDFSSVPLDASIAAVSLDYDVMVNEAFITPGDTETLRVENEAYNISHVPGAYSPMTELAYAVTDPGQGPIGSTLTGSYNVTTSLTRAQLNTLYSAVYSDGHLGYDYICYNVAYDVPPTITLSGPTTTSQNTPFTVTIDAGQTVTGLTLSDIIVGNGVASNLSGTGPYTVTITPSSIGNVTISIPTNSITNITGQDNTSPSNTLTVGNNNPAVVLISSGGGYVPPVTTPTTTTGTTGTTTGTTTTTNTSATYISPIDGTVKACTPFTKYLKLGSTSNNVQEVKMWQAFLNKFQAESLPLTGFYGSKTFAAIKRFQESYRTDILTPWGLNNPTGWTYKSTRAKGNKILGCPEGSVLLDNGVTIN